MPIRNEFSSSSTPKRLTDVVQGVLDGIFDEPSNALRIPFAYWLATSKPFLAFAQNYTSKIRKKVRICRDIEELYNLYTELRTAYILLQEPKFALAYEPYGMATGRSADYAVNFRTNALFHVEVTRLRLSQSAQLSDSAQEEAIRNYEARRLVDVLCDKIRQLSPETPNILWVWSESQLLPTLDLGQILLGLKRNIEQRDADLFARYGFTKPADFTRLYQRLSAVVLFSLRDAVDAKAMVLWLNKEARYALPSKVETRLRTLMAADDSPIFMRVGE